MNAQFDFIPRAEYERYLTWAAAGIRNVHYGVHVDRVGFDGEHGFTLYTPHGPVATSRHLVMGVGTRSAMPAGLAALPADRLVLADHLRTRIAGIAAAPDAPVAVVGGGQTGLECVLALLRAGCTDVQWFGRHQWFSRSTTRPSRTSSTAPRTSSSSSSWRCRPGAG